MAIAKLHETLLSYTLRKNQLNLEITNLQAQKTLGTSSRADAQNLLSAQKKSTREYFKKLYDNDPELQAKYKDYTEIPDFEAEIDKYVAANQDELDQLTAWEEQINAQITTDSAELEEINAYMESIKSMLSSNIQEDFNYGLNG